MEVQINNCRVDFSLEGEKTVSDVIKSITGWANERSLIFTEACIDGSDYNIEQIPEILIKDAAVINCKVQSRAEIIISCLNESIDYSIKADKFINRSIADNIIEKSQRENLIKGIEWIIDVTDKVLNLLSYQIQEIKYKDNTIKDYIDRLLSLKNCIEENINPILLDYLKKEKDLFSDLIGIFRMLLISNNMKSVVIQSIDSPDILINSIFNIKKEISEQLVMLEETAAAFQTGKDNEATSKLQLFIDFIFRYNRTCHQILPVFGINPADIIVGEKNLNAKNSEIYNLLNQVISAMENNDIISLSDILEYEIKPSLENLANYIDLLINMATNNETAK